MTSLTKRTTSHVRQKQSFRHLHKANANTELNKQTYDNLKVELNKTKLILLQNVCKKGKKTWFVQSKQNVFVCFKDNAVVLSM